jgi:hypothetical protein
LSLLFTFFVSSCSDTKTYADLLEDEELLISDYIKRNNINVLSQFPANGVWREKDYVLTESGLYFHLVKAGEGTDSLATSNSFTLRYRQYSLDEDPTVIDKWTTDGQLEPVQFSLNVNANRFLAIHEAAAIMKKTNSEAKIIVPSSIGNTLFLGSNVTPYMYEIKINLPY